MKENKLEELLNSKNVQIVRAPRNQSLEKTGLIITHYINVDGLSQYQAQEEISTFISDYKDEGEISKNVQFYKEYWIPVRDTPTRIEINVI